MPLATVRAAFGAAPAPFRAGVLATGATIFFAVMAGLIRHAAEELHPLQVVFFRNLFALLFMLPWLMRMGMHVMYTRRIGLYSVRAVVQLGSMICGFTSLTLIPLAEATALSFTAPIFSTIGAALILREVVRLRRWTAIAIGFAGTMVILRPGFEALSFGSVLALVNALFMAASVLMVKSLSRTEPPDAIVMYMAVFLTPMSLVPAVFVWQTPSLEMLGWMLLLAASGTAGHILMTRAFSTADVTVVLPFDFGRLPFTAIVAYFAFGQIPTVWTWLGGAVIFASTFYIAHRESVLARQARAAKSPRPTPEGAAFPVASAKAEDQTETKA